MHISNDLLFASIQTYNDKIVETLYSNRVT